MMKKLGCIVLCAVLLMFSLCSCDSVKKVSDEMFALDTIITFNITGSDEKLCKTTIDICKKEIVRLENMLSATKDDSDIYSINHAQGETVQISKETTRLLEKSKELSQKCNGAFDVSVYPLVKLWGFDTKEYKVPKNDEISLALENVSYKNIRIDVNSVTLENGMSIDLGAIAKGYIADKLYEIMLDQGIRRGVINLGGLVIMGGQDNATDFSIGVEYPDTKEIFATFESDDGFVVTSGDYQRYFEENGVRYHHIIDPKTGKPAQSDISSVTVITDDGVFGDAFSTAFFVMGIDKTIEYLENRDEKFDVIILNSNKDEIYVSSELIENGFRLDNSFKDKIKVNIIGTDD